MEVLTGSEKLAINQLRDKVRDLLEDEFSKLDENLVRWLRARDLDLEKAEAMIRQSLQWRIDNKIETILESGFDPAMVRMFPYYMDGLDREGRLVLTVPIGQWDIRSSVEKDGPEKFVRYSRQLLELAFKKMRELHDQDKSNKARALRYTVICDYEGFGLRQLANMKSVQTILQIVGAYEAHYPETLNTGIVINAPAAFSILFGLMKPLMTARTVNKIKIFNSDRQKWEPEVLSFVDPSQIRERFGGTKSDK